MPKTLDQRPNRKTAVRCYVCDREIKATAVYVGQGKYRHERCCPGSARWLESPIGRKSKLRAFFLLERKS